MQENKKFNPFLLPSESGTLYLYLNVISILLIFIAVSRLVEHYTQVELLVFIVISIILLLAGYCKSLVRFLLASNIPEELNTKLKDFFKGKADSIKFRQTNENDFSAWNYLKTKVCFIPKRYIYSLTDEIDNQYFTLRYTTLVAHEIAHLVTGDSKTFQRSTMLAGLAFWACLSILYTAWPVTLGAKIFVFFWFTIVLLFVLFLIYYIIRIREYYADYTASYLMIGDNIEKFLQKMSLREKYLKFSMFYKLTHPLFSERLKIFNKFVSIHEYSHLKCFLAASITVLTTGAYGVAKTTALYPKNWLISFVEVLFVFYMSYRIFSIQIITSTLVDKLNLKKCVIMSLEIMFIIIIFFSAIVIPVYTFPREFNPVDLSSSLPLPLWQTIAALFFVSLILHLTYWWGSRRYLCYRGPKHPDQWFFFNSTVWLGVIGIFLGMTCMSFVYAFKENPDYGILEGLLFASLFFLLPTLYLIRRWKKRVAKQSIKWGCEPTLCSAEFIESEWSHQSLVNT